MKRIIGNTFKNRIIGRKKKIPVIHQGLFVCMLELWCYWPLVVNWIGFVLL